MTSNPQPGLPNRVPQWIIAFSLLTIAICLVALVLRSFTGREPEATATAVESPAKETPTRDHFVRIVSPARAASAPSEASDSNSTEATTESPTQTVVQTSQTIVITPPLRGLALGAKKDGDTDSSSGRKLVGTIIGRVVLEGEPPAERTFTVPEPVDCERLISHPPTTHNYVVGTNRGLANVFLQLVPATAPGPVVAKVTNTMSLTFSNCDLQPYLVAGTPQDRVVLRNATTHRHVLEVSLREGLAPFLSIPLEAGEEFHRPVYDLVSHKETHIFGLRCALHAWEQSLLVLAKEPFFATTDFGGCFAFSNVPPYSYRLELFHGDSSKPKTTSDITLFAGATEVRTLRIRPQR